VRHGGLFCCAAAGPNLLFVPGGHALSPSLALKLLALSCCGRRLTLTLRTLLHAARALPKP